MTNFRGWWRSSCISLSDETGSLTAFELLSKCGFSAERLFWIHSVDSPAVIRGGHAHKDLKQAIVCLRGEVDISLESDTKAESFKLSAHNEVLIVEGMVWREMSGFSEDTILLVACDRPYSEDIVIRSRVHWQRLMNLDL